MAELLVRVHEGARALDARGRVDDLVAMHLAPAALQLVLGPERKLRDGQCLEALGRLLHDGIVVAQTGHRKT